MPIEIFLDDAKKFKVSVSNTSDSFEIEFPDDLQDLKKYLFVQMDDKEPVALNDLTNNKFSVSLDKYQGNCKIILKSDPQKFKEGETPRVHTLARISVPGIKESATFSYKKYSTNSPLTTYAIKTLVHTGKLPEIHNRNAHHDVKLKTDLHSHFAAIPTAENLVDMATDNGMNPFYFPMELLESAGVNVNHYSQLKNKADLPVVIENAVLKNKKIEWVNSLSPESPRRGLVNSETLDEKVKGTDKYKKFVDVNSLDPADRKILLDHLSIPPAKQITFDDMEEYYVWRETFVKNLDYLDKLLEICAKNYAVAGVAHASLSFSARICKPEWLAVADRVLPELEKRYGVKMRFLVGMSRLLDNTQQEDILEQFKAVADHPSIEGVDVFASEINSTYDFYVPLAKLGKWCSDNGFRDKVIRIHAGETPYHPENVSAAVMLANATKMHVRVGHGLYGSADDDQLLSFFKQNNMREFVIMEMCPDSNYALNHVDNTQNHALRELADAGVPIVFGSDGAGLYYTDAKQLAKHLDLIKFDEKAQLENVKHQVAATENFYMEVNNHYYERDKMNLEQKIKPKIAKKIDEKAAAEISKRMSAANEKNVKFTIDSHQKAQIRDEVTDKFYNKIREEVIVEHYKERGKQFNKRLWNAQRESEVKQKKEARKIKLKEALKENQITVIELSQEQGKEDIVPFPNDKTPVMLTGGLQDDLTQEQLTQVLAMVDALVKSCDPEKVCFVSTGNDHGLQKIINQSAKNFGFDVVGLISKNAKAEYISPNITHAVLGYDSWYDMHGFIGKQLKYNKDFQLMIVGGNMLTRHIIQTGVNVITEGDLSAPNEQMYLVKGISGAAHDKGLHLPEQFSVDGLGELLEKFAIHMERKGNLKVKSNQVMTTYQNNCAIGNWVGGNENRDLWMEKVIEVAHGDVGAVDATDRAKYFMAICDAHGIKIDGMKVDNSLITEEVLDFFKHGCSSDDPFLEKLITSSNAVAIEEALAPHFATFGLPDLTERINKAKRKFLIEKVSDSITKDVESLTKMVRQASDRTVKAISKSLDKKEPPVLAKYRTSESTLKKDVTDEKENRTAVNNKVDPLITNNKPKG